MNDAVDTTAKMPGMLVRIGSALPDALTALFFMTVWLMPLRFGDDLVKTAILMMLIEFITVHAAGFLMGVLAGGGGASRSGRATKLVGVGAFYFLFIVGFVLAFDQWWPIVAFGWLLLGKFARVLFAPEPPKQVLAAQAQLVGLSVLFYVGFVVATVFLPLPRLGITEAVLPQLGLPGSGLWVEQPHRLMAFGVLYFTALAVTKYRMVVRS